MVSTLQRVRMRNLPPVQIQRFQIIRFVLLITALAGRVLTPAGAQDPPQAIDHSDLTVFRTDAGTLKPVRSKRDWEQRRADILRGMQAAMGPLPNPRPSLDFDVQITERLKGNGFERLTINFVVEGNDRLPADLYLPASRREGERRPAMLALHPTGALGKRIVAGAKPNRQYATELAERGYVVLAPDYPSFGDLKDYDFASDSYVSGTMKGIVNHMRCVDYLLTRPEVDGDRIGVIGHSLGGHNALFAAAFDQRLKVAVSSCGWTPFHYYYGGKVAGWTSDRYMPRIRDEFHLNADEIPFDFYEVIAAIAPRAVYSASPVNDSNFAVAGVRAAEPRIRSVYDLYDATNRFAVEYPECAHDFPKAVRDRAYAFIDRALKFDPVAAPDFAAELPRIPPTEAEHALSTFRIHPDFELQLVASEPNVVDPVAACFDAYGRLYVVEMRGYSEDREKELGRVRRLEDRDGDGVFEHSVVYADRLKWPTAIAPYRGGVLVAAAPHIYYLVDGVSHLDERADRDPQTGDYPIVLTGLKHTNVQGLVNCMRWGLDGRIHVATSSSGAELIRVGRDDPPLSLRGRDFSFDPRLIDPALLKLPGNDERVGWSDERWQAYEQRVVDSMMRVGLDEDEAVRFAAEETKTLRTRIRSLASARQFNVPRKPAIRAESGGGQHGMCFDDLGRKFVCQNSNHIQFVRYEDRYAARAPGVPAPASRRSIAVDGPQAEVYRTSPIEPWRLVRTRLRVSGLVRGPVEGGGRAGGYFTGATGTTIYRGDAWPEQYKGQAFVGDVGSNIVHRKILKRDGIGFLANRAQENVEFLTSTDNWFRPVQFLHGPDGNLYVLDMYRETIEHPASLPPQIKKHVDLTSGRDRGRIYRIVHRKNPKARFTYPAAVTPRHLAGWLDRGNAWERETAARLLFEKQALSSVEPLREVATQGRTPLGRIHALCALLNVRNSLTDEVLLAALVDSDAGVREHAVRLAESRLVRSASLREAVARLRDDPEIRVRCQVAFSAAALDDAAPGVVEHILRRDAQHEVVRWAAVASAGTRAPAVLASLAADQTFRSTSAGRTAIQLLASLAVRNNAARQVMEIALNIDAQEPVLADALLETVRRGGKVGSDPAVKAGMKRLVQTARDQVGNPENTTALRVAACRRLRLLPEADDVDMLLDLVASDQPRSLQLAAIETLGVHRTDEVATGLIAAFPGLTPEIQTAVVSQLVAREAWATALLQKVLDKTLPPSAITVSQVNALLSSPSSTVARLAKQFNESRKATSRAEVVKQWQDVLTMKGDAAAGREVFRQTCAKCHKLEGVGEEIGAGLAAIRNRGPEAVLLNILDPNREVNPQYSSFVVVTTDGRSVSGLIANETASGITLRDGEKVNVTIPRDQIDEMRNTGLSLMPEGLEKQISRQQMADLLRYLMTVQQ